MPSWTEAFIGFDMGSHAVPLPLPNPVDALFQQERRRLREALNQGVVTRQVERSLAVRDAEDRIREAQMRIRTQMETGMRHFVSLDQTGFDMALIQRMGLGSGQKTDPIPNTETKPIPDEDGPQPTTRGLLDWRDDSRSMDVDMEPRRRDIED